MHGGQLAARGSLAAVDIDHVMGEAEHSGADFENTTANLEDVAGQELALVADVLLHRCHAAAAGVEIRRGQPDLRKQMPHRFIEFPDIPHDIHMADMIAVPWVYGTAISKDVRHRPSAFIRQPGSCDRHTDHAPRSI